MKTHLNWIYVQFLGSEYGCTINPSRIAFITPQKNGCCLCFSALDGDNIDVAHSHDQVLELIKNAMEIPYE